MGLIVVYFVVVVVVVVVDFHTHLMSLSLSVSLCLSLSLSVSLCLSLSLLLSPSSSPTQKKKGTLLVRKLVVVSVSSFQQDNYLHKVMTSPPLLEQLEALPRQASRGERRLVAFV